MTRVNLDDHTRQRVSEAMSPCEPGGGLYKEKLVRLYAVREQVKTLTLLPTSTPAPPLSEHSLDSSVKCASADTTYVRWTGSHSALTADGNPVLFILHEMVVSKYSSTCASAIVLIQSAASSNNNSARHGIKHNQARHCT